MNLTGISHLFFDMDNTIVPSAQPILAKTEKELIRLSKLYDIVIVSGTDCSEIIRLVGTAFDYTALGCSGNEISKIKDGKVVYSTASEMCEATKVVVIDAMKSAIHTFMLPDLSGNNDQILDRGSQVTLSCIGRSADPKKKDPFDPDKTLREDIVKHITEFCDGLLVNDFSITIGGSTSVDVVEGFSGKGSGILAYLTDIFVAPSEVVYFGDQTQYGGNDYSAVQVIPMSVRVTNHLDTTNILARIS